MRPSPAEQRASLRRCQVLEPEDALVERTGTFEIGDGDDGDERCVTQFRHSRPPNWPDTPTRLSLREERRPAGARPSHQHRRPVYPLLRLPRAATATSAAPLVQRIARMRSNVVRRSRYAKGLVR